eukprot:Nk52_evm98s1810 gene=Nk52_evmTU98s1810
MLLYRFRSDSRCVVSNSLLHLAQAMYPLKQTGSSVVSALFATRNSRANRFLSTSTLRSGRWYSNYPPKRIQMGKVSVDVQANSLANEVRNSWGFAPWCFSFRKGLYYPNISMHYDISSCICAGTMERTNPDQLQDLSEYSEPEEKENDFRNDNASELIEEDMGLNFLLSMIKDDWGLLLVSVIASFGAAVMNIKIPMLLGGLINCIEEYLVNKGPSETVSFTIFWGPASKLLICYVIQGLLTAAYIAFLSFVGERMALRLRYSLYSSLIYQDISFFDTHNSGEIVTRITTDIQDFKSSFKQCVSQGLKSITQFIGSFLALCLVSPKLTLLLGIVVPLMVGSGSAIAYGLRSKSKEAQNQISKVSAHAQETISQVRTVRAFAMEEKECELFSNDLEKCKNLNEELGIGIGIFQGLSNFAINSMTMVVLYYGGYLVLKHEITSGELMSFLVSTQSVQRSLGSLSILFGQVVRGLTAYNRVVDYIKILPSITDSEGIEISNPEGTISFKDVSFHYPSRPLQNVLDKLNLEIPTGKVVALCGPSGGGKSTIASLIERFYDPDQGHVCIDGHPLPTISSKWLRGHLIAYINQEPALFATTIIENIRYGKPDATDEEVFEAAKMANADKFIRDFPKGYHTILGERGVTVSGGQRQRIAIARALLRNPKVLILDEATSALDAESERLVQEALDTLMRGRTVLVIAHRLSTIQNADSIAVIVKGKIVEFGNHRDLLRRRGVYADLISKQSSGLY